MQDNVRGDSAVLVKRLEDQIKGLQREINLPSQEAASLSQLTAGTSSSSPCALHLQSLLLCMQQAISSFEWPVVAIAGDS